MLMNLKIGARLGIGFGLAVLVTVVVGVVSLHYIRDLSGLTNKLYRHPFAVSTSTLQIKEAITSMHRSMKDVALSKDDAGIDKASRKVDVIEKETMKYFDVLQDRFLGDKNKIGELRRHFIGWKPIRDEVIALMRKGERAAAAEITRAKGANYIKELYDKLTGLEKFAFNKADEFVANANKDAEDAVTFAIAIIIIGVIIAAFFAFLITRSISQPIRELLNVSQAIAGGDLTRDVAVKSRDEVGQLQRAMHSMVEQLRDIVGQVHNATSEVSNGAAQIAQGNSDLSQRTEEQASSLEETASSMEQLTSTVKQNADNARQANQLGEGARGEAEKGGEVVNQAVAAMGEINQSSKKIADIIGVIDEIAFQTNLLALNAAVEAARAGEQGRGFAVVAQEVRKLAQRSADSAKEISDLIKASVNQVEEGSRLVDASGAALGEILESVKKVTDIVAEIAAASAEQSDGIEQVNRAITQMDGVVQQNAALVEEAAAASKSMEEESGNLRELMGFFKIDLPSNGAPARHATPAPRSAPRAARPAPKAVPKPAAKTLAAPKREAPAKAAGGDEEWEEF